MLLITPYLASYSNKVHIMPNNKNFKRMETGLSSYKTAVSDISELDSSHPDEMDSSPNSSNSNAQGTLIATVIPKEFQDYNSKNLYSKKYRIDERKFVRETCNLIVTEDNEQIDYDHGFSFDTIIDVDGDINDLVISLDLVLPIVEENKAVIVHMNRSPMEMANKTLKRLELSATKKMVQVLDPKHRKSLGNQGKNNDRGEQKSLYCQIFLRTESYGSIHESELNIERQTSFELFDMIAKKNFNVDNSNSYSGIRLTIPKSYKQELDTNETFEMSEIELKINSNPPTILSVTTFESFAGKLYVNVPITIQTEIIYASKAVVSWFVNEELVLHDSHYFVPDASHVGKNLSVLVTPFLKGCQVGPNSEAYAYENAIEALPFMPILSPLRDDFTRVKRTNNAFKDYVRVISYNILADLYVSCSRGSIDQRMVYPHTDYEYLKRSRRMPMILAEILSYQPDIICLQEVDCSAYETYLEPAMHAKGYDGFYSNKASSQPEGCAIFWSTRVFEGIDRITVTLRDLFDEDDFFDDDPRKKDNEIKPEFKHWDSMREIQQLLHNNKELKKVTMEKIGQILQIATLKLKGDCQNRPGHVLIANTHLFYHPLADHIRAIQAYVVCKKIDEVRRIPRGGEVACPLILCGDLNSDPLSGASQLLFSRSVEPSHRDCWKNLHVYKWEYGDESYLLEHEYIGNGVGAKDLVWEEEQFMDAKENETVNFKKKKPPTISLPDSFPTLVSGCFKIPEFTNYAVDFAETLDYILASEPSATECYGFVPIRDARFPSTDEMKQFVAMPNEFMPSDHVSVVCDLQWRKYNAEDQSGEEGEEWN